MRQTIFLLLVLAGHSGVWAQNPVQNDSLIRRLSTEIANADDVQSQYIGCYGHLSNLYKKVDTLKTVVGIKTFTEYLDAPSVNLKYYAFIELVALNENLAFEKLHEKENKDSINYQFAGQFSGQARLLDLLTAEYLIFIKAKYYYGGISMYQGRTYTFGKKDRKTWRRKTEAIEKFISDYALSEKWIKMYTR